MPSWPSPKNATSAKGSWSTVTEAVPLMSWMEAVTVPVPPPVAVTSPSAATVKMAGSLVDQVTVPSKVSLSWSRILALNPAVAPT